MPPSLICNDVKGKVVARFVSDSLSPPNGERVGMRGKHLKIKRPLTPPPPIARRPLLSDFLLTFILIILGDSVLN
jgi:hypothetical protein